MLWIYLGAATLSADDANAPVVTTSTVSAGLTNARAPINYPNLYRMYGCYSAYAAGGSGFGLATFNRAPGLPTPRMVGIAFETDAPKFAIRIANNSGAIRFVIDGRYYSVSGMNLGATDTWVIFDYTSKGGRKKRSVLVEGSMGTNLNFMGVTTDVVDQVWAPSAVDDVRALFISDSIWAGSSYGPYLSGASAPSRLSKMLGWKDPWQFTEGGTGYIGSAGGTRYTYGERIAEALTRNPDIWAFMGSTNDIGQPGAAITAAALSCFQAIRTGGSTAPIIVFGVWSLNDASYALTSKVAYVENAIKAAVAAFSDPLGKTFFIPIRQDPDGPWVTGSWNNFIRWSANAAVALHKTILANGNEYVCTTAGTTAASGTGPSGTGSGIADGTAVWSYLGPASGFYGNGNSSNGTLMIAGDATHPADIGTTYLASRMARAMKTLVLPYL